MAFFIEHNEALDLIRSTKYAILTENKKVSDSLGCVISENIISPIFMPPFNQSAMDGYAVSDKESSYFKVVGEMKAGDSSSFDLSKGEAIRIFTGAMVPEGVYAVVRQEDAETKGDSVYISKSIKKFENIRPKGEQVEAGGIGVQKGTFITPGVIGHLSTLGITHVQIYKKPSVALITTGNELIQPGQPLTEGKIYESNSLMLQAAFQEQGCDCSVHFVKDDIDSTRNAIQELNKKYDILILTGGISVGDYDFVGKALNDLGVKEVFYKVKQKPGKPLFFGILNEKPVFGLPGNPAAALTCFYVYVREVINAMKGKRAHTERYSFPLNAVFSKPPTLTHLLKAKIENGSLTILPAQNSSMLTSFSEANCIAIAESGKENWKKNESMNVIYLPQQ